MRARKPELLAYLASQPQRIRFRRIAGFDLQLMSRALNDRPAVLATRPGPWRNPCKVGMYRGYTAEDAVRDYLRWMKRDPAVRSFENTFGRPPTLQAIRTCLAGKNIACYCEVGATCHGDVLLDIANGRMEIEQHG